MRQFCGQLSFAVQRNAHLPKGGSMIPRTIKRRFERSDDERRRGVSFSSMPRKNILGSLKGGDRRSIGRAEEVAAAYRNFARFPELIRGLWSEDPLVRMRAADAAEKITRSSPDLLRPHKRELLGLMVEAKQQELRWHLAAMAQAATRGCEPSWPGSRSEQSGAEFL
jgi:hypothetical protein